MIRTIQLVATRYEREAGEKFDSPNVLRVMSRYAGDVVRLKLGYITPEGSARQVTEGPLVPGPWVYTYPLSTVMTADPRHSSAAESQRLAALDLEWQVKVGDLFVIDGRLYRLTEDAPRREYPQLTLIDEDTLRAALDAA